jgi:PhzF family phenazine biosynthesis protein
MSQSRRYVVVDVFTARPLLGNPVAVVLDAEGLDTATMQAIARWTNLSETTFVLAPSVPEADYRLRIFTPGSELPFAGHPTLGSAHAILESRHIKPRRDDRLIQQCSVGLVHVTIDERSGTRRLAFELPDSKIGSLHPADVMELEHILGCSGLVRTAPATVNVGPVWVVAHLGDARSVLDLQPDFAKLSTIERRLGITGVTVFGAHESGDAAIEVRSFAPSCGVNEDPVCGSGNGSVAAFQWSRGMLPPAGLDYVAAQGCRVGRDGRVHVRVDANGKVRVGGSCVTCVEGTLTL